MIDVIKQYSNFAIFGAQVVAYGAYVALRSLCDIMPKCFLVSSVEGNPSEIDGVAVHSLDKCVLDAPNTLVLVAVTELLQDEVSHTLKKRRFQTLILDSHAEHMLMSSYFDSIGKFPLLQENNGCLSTDIALYEVRNHRDKPLSNHPQLFDWEYSIQAGAAITDAHIIPILDNSGDNISAKNKQYCEMTATYWVWKNTSHAWKGIEHYRRHLIIRPEQIDDSVDAILPLPYICYPNTLAQFRRFVSEDVLNSLLYTLHALRSRHYDEYMHILHGRYQYTYNLFCAKASVFDAYCKWFFEITEYMETLNVPEIANTRALSYVAEVLTNLYFMSNSDKLNIQHVEKRIYV